MCDLSEYQVNGLRAWLRVTRAMYCTEVLPFTVRRLPLSLMVLVHVYLQLDQEASYSELRTTYKLAEHSRLSHAIRPLIKRELVKRVWNFKNDRRMRGLRLLEPGRNAIARLLKSAAANEPPPR